VGSERYARGASIVARLAFGDDLLAAVGRLAEEHGVTVGEFRAIGALQRGALSFYDQAPPDPRQRTYVSLPLNEPLEIVSLLGTVSRRDGATAVHAHACLADQRGRCYGGHVAEGCVAFACEVVLDELAGAPLERVYDETTGLALWARLRD
jgi:predicted DNA-binding protein with PD1-like motif